jgi:predicted nucleic acid-binding protein
MIILDTDIFIEILKGNLDLNKLPNNQAIALSAITAMELFCGAFNKRELNKITKALTSFEVIQVDSDISVRSISLIQSYAKSHNLNIPDAIIAATAIDKGVTLYSRNLRDFRFIDLLQLKTI